MIVARTFSKAYGMAGMRVGYALGHPDTIKRARSWEGASAMNVPGIVAADHVHQGPGPPRRRARGTPRPASSPPTGSAKAGFSATDSQTNFVFVNIKRPAKGFRDACQAQGVLVARDFPPFEKSHVRISIGTLDEMKQAVEVFGKVLGVKAKAA